MTIWVDAHISPGVAAWINKNFPYEVTTQVFFGGQYLIWRKKYEKSENKACTFKIVCSRYDLCWQIDGKN
jgi:hypothetical protein